MKIHIVSKSNCPFCVKAKDLLVSLKKDYTEEVIDNEDERKQFYLKCGDGVKSVPQVFLDGLRIGGYTELLLNIEKITGKTKMEDSSITFKPFKYQWAVTRARAHEQTHWIEDEIPLGEDVSDWKSNKLTLEEKAFITNVLKLFTQSDLTVSDLYHDNLIPKFKNNEVRMMLSSFANIEKIHQRSYALLNETLGFPDSDWYAFLEYEQMVDKVEFMKNSDLSTKKGTALCLAKNVFSEGVMLFASFAMLLNFVRFGKMKGMSKIVEFSIRDENQHAEGIAELFTTYLSENPKIVTDELKKSIYEMAKEVVNLEDAFIKMTFAMGKPEGLEEEDVKNYTRYMTNQRLLSLGMKEIFDVKENPLEWIDWIVSGSKHGNFFEQKITDYQASGLTGDWTY
jgi:glutaredoxin 3